MVLTLCYRDSLDVRQGATCKPDDHTLSTQMMTYWTNFAKTGDPNGSGLTKWPRYDTSKAVIHFDTPITAGPDSTRAEFEFLTSTEAKH